VTETLTLEDFEYDLPQERIAQEPLGRRDASRLMILDRATGRFTHAMFADLATLLAPGDLLVVNDTRVVPARLRGRRAAPGTGGRVEALLVERRSEHVWKALLRGAARPDEPIEFGQRLFGRVERREDDGSVLLALSTSGDDVPLDEALESAGLMPTPPYIRREPDDPREQDDRRRYQTIFASHAGALAAPTAGLHFTPALLARIRARGVEVAALTLHVGLGTFLPVRAGNLDEHRMHAERYAVGEALCAALSRTRAGGGRVVAVGTTVTRTLEALAAEDGTVRPGEGWCDLFIRPGHRFRAVDALVTNFHLPRSSLLMLVSAFAGREQVLAAYREAIRAEYRFYSYGDAMLIA